MFWKTGSHACFLMLSASLTIACPNAYGENLAGQGRLNQVSRTDQLIRTDRVVSVSPDLANGSITITTNSKNPVAAPLIQYLPGPDGKTLMVADFEGVSYQLATHLLKPENLAPDAWRQSSIQEIRIGQFSSQPPTMRISIGAFNARAFRTLAFHARPGALILKWTPGNPAQVHQTPTAESQALRTPTSPYPVAQAPVEVAPLAPDYRKAAQSVSSSGTASSTRRAKDVSAQGGTKPSPAREIKAEKLSEKMPEKPPEKFTEKLAKKAPEKLVDTSQWIAQPDAKSTDKRTRKSAIEDQGKKADGGILYKSTTAGIPAATRRESAIRTGDNSSEDRAVQKPLSAVARWLKLDVASKSDSESKAKETQLQDVRDTQKFLEQSTKGRETQPPIAPQFSAREAETDVAGEDGQVQVTINDIEQLKDKGATDVLIKTDRRLNYKVFRLHEPERYVVDFDGLPALQSAQLPSIEEELLVKGMRTGTPDDTGLTHRLVLDLKDNTVDVADELVDNGRSLSLRIRPSASAPMPSQLKAQLVKDKLIVLDAGHGGSDPGAQRSGVSEKDLTLQITNQLRKRLSQLGARVVMTRSDDTFVSLEDRVKITNETQPDLFVSIHINALESTSSIYGIETYYQTDQSRALATAIHQQLVQGLSVPDRSVRKARFYVINHTAVPAILAEVGFISNQQERDNLGSADYQVKIADSVSSGIVQYLTEKQELAGKSGKQAF